MYVLLFRDVQLFGCIKAGSLSHQIGNLQTSTLQQLQMLVDKPVHSFDRQVSYPSSTARTWPNDLDIARHVASAMDIVCTCLMTWTCLTVFESVRKCDTACTAHHEPKRKAANTSSGAFSTSLHWAASTFIIMIVIACCTADNTVRLRFLPDFGLCLHIWIHIWKVLQLNVL